VDQPVKLLLTWDISPDHEQDYFEFVLGEFVPGIQRLGLQPSEAWVTVYGEYPQIQVGLLAASLEIARRAISSDGWRDLHDKLYAFVKNYSCKVVPVRGGFQF
jgi:hypothetical protein